MGQYVYEQLIPKSELNIQSGSVATIIDRHEIIAVEKPIFLEAWFISSNGQLKITSIERYENDEEYYFMSPLSNTEYLRLVYTSMPEEGGYYYGYGEELPTTGIYLVNNSTIPLTRVSMYDGDKLVIGQQISSDVYWLEVPQDFIASNINAFVICEFSEPFTPYNNNGISIDGEEFDPSYIEISDVDEKQANVILNENIVIYAKTALVEVIIK